MHFAIIIIVVCALAAGESTLSWSGATPHVPVALTIAGMLLVVLLARIVAGATALGLQRNFSRRQSLLRRFRRWRMAHAAVWFATSLAIVFGLSWAHVVRVDLGVQGTFLVDELLILAPVLVPLAASWAAFYEVHRVVQRLEAETAGHAGRVMTRQTFVGVQVRHYLGLILVPLLMVLACGDLLDLAAPEMAAGPRSAALASCLLSLIAVYPWLLRLVWRTQRLPAGKLRDRLEAINADRGVRVRDILLWHSGGTISNAAVAGVLPGVRYVFLSDGLLSRMDEDQIAAVYAHEVGHVRHRHGTLRLVALAAAVVVWQMTASLLAGNGSLDLLGRMPWPTAGMCAAAMLVLAGGLVLVFSMYCRALELQADLSASAVGSLAQHRSAPTRPYDPISAALAELNSPGGASTSGLFHPTVGRRITFLHQMTAQPQQVARFHRRLSFVAWTWLLIVLLGAAYWWLPL